MFMLQIQQTQTDFNIGFAKTKLMIFNLYTYHCIRYLTTVQDQLYYRYFYTVLKFGAWPSKSNT